jgi:DNA-binding SARP family transcriptional activator/tetratricopeptide (TPR) repeat protein
MDFRILGPLEVWDRGRPIEIRRGKQRVLLALLLLRAGEPISTDGLVDGLWGESPPPTAKASLQNYVAQLRRSLGPGVLTSEGGGYRLDVTPEQTDLGRFERLTTESRGETGRGRVEKLREALALWRGPPLADLVFEPFAAEEIGRLEELRTAALEDAIDAELSLGRADGLIGELEFLIAEHPFRERLRAQLMLALYRSGRQADALDVYRQTRQLLLDELGIEPSAPLRQLEQAILRQDEALAQAQERDEVASTPDLRRKTVTVLVADVDFSETLDPELLRETSVRALAGVRRILEAHGGTIEQRAGDEVMAVFGVPRAHEDDALRAARAALELQAEMLPPQSLRIGIETGEVLAGADEAGHGFVAGAAITLAKRLQQQARNGDILAGPAARRLLGSAVEAERSSKGQAETFRLRQVVEDVPALPRNLDAPLADREQELAELHNTFGAAIEEHRCRLFLLVGEAGIGKTRLSRELTAELEGAATILVGRCVSYGKGATYLPLVEIIRQLEARTSLRDLLASDEHAPLIEARLAELVGEEGSVSGGETFWAVRRLFEALAAKQPVVLVFEDLHWAEATLLDLIEYLAAVKAPIFLLGLARPELLEERSAWREVDPRRLAPLSSDDGGTLIENLGPVPDELRTKILGTAEGNPLFIEQLLAHVAEESELETLPPSLESLLASRLDRLELGELSVLQHAAVVGREFSLDALVGLLPEREAAFAHLPALGRKGLIRERRRETGEEGSYGFHHVLICDAAYATLPKVRRAELHERFAHWVKARPGSSDEVIGFHLEQAFRHLAELGSNEVEARRLAAEAGERLAAAGLRAAKSGDAPAAANLLTRASSLLGTDEVVRRDLLAELGLALWLGGDLESAEQTFGAALEAAISSHDRRAELRARLERAFLKLFRAPEGAADALLELAEAAIPELEQLEDDRTLGRYWYVLAHVHGGFHCRYRESAEAAERAIVHFDRSGWPLAPCLQELAASLYIGPVDVAEGIRHCQRLLADADRGGQANVLVFQAGLEAMAARFEIARELVTRALAIYEDLAWTDKISANCAAIAADIELLAGNHADAERLLHESCERLEAAGDRARLATQGAQLGEALYRQGRFDEAEHWSEVAETSAATDDASAQFSWRALRAKGLAQQGAFDEANALAEAAVDIAAGTDALSQHAQVLLVHAEVLLLEGRSSEATATAESAVRLLERKGNVAAIENVRSVLPEFAGI